jgi:hypothetical protein
MPESPTDERRIALTDAQVALAWQLTFAMVSNDDNRRTLDQAFIAAARFVERVENGLSGDGVELDSGKGNPPQRLTYRVVRVP